MIRVSDKINQNGKRIKGLGTTISAEDYKRLKENENDLDKKFVEIDEGEFFIDVDEDKKFTVCYFKEKGKKFSKFICDAKQSDKKLTIRFDKGLNNFKDVTITDENKNILLGVAYILENNNKNPEFHELYRSISSLGKDKYVADEALTSLSLLRERLNKAQNDYNNLINLKDAEIRDIQEDNSKNLSRTKKLERKLDETKEQYERVLSAEREIYKASLKDNNEKIFGLSIDYIKNIKQKDNELNETKRYSQGLIDSKQKEIEEIYSKMMNYTEQINELEIKVKQLENDSYNLKEKNTFLEQENKEFKEENEYLKKDNENTSINFEKTYIENGELQQTIKELNDKINELTTQIKEFEKQDAQEKARQEQAKKAAEEQAKKDAEEKAKRQTEKAVEAVATKMPKGEAQMIGEIKEVEMSEELKEHVYTLSKKDKNGKEDHFYFAVGPHWNPENRKGNGKENRTLYMFKSFSDYDTKEMTYGNLLWALTNDKARKEMETYAVKNVKEYTNAKVKVSYYFNKTEEKSKEIEKKTQDKDLTAKEKLKAQLKEQKKGQKYEKTDIKLDDVDLKIKTETLIDEKGELCKFVNKEYGKGKAQLLTPKAKKAGIVSLSIAGALALAAGMGTFGYYHLEGGPNESEKAREKAKTNINAYVNELDDETLFQYLPEVDEFGNQIQYTKLDENGQKIKVDGQEVVGIGAVDRFLNPKNQNYIGMEKYTQESFWGKLKDYSTPTVEGMFYQLGMEACLECTENNVPVYTVNEETSLKEPLYKYIVDPNNGNLEKKQDMIDYLNSINTKWEVEKLVDLYEEGFDAGLSNAIAKDVNGVINSQDKIEPEKPEVPLANFKSQEVKDALKKVISKFDTKFNSSEVNVSLYSQVDGEIQDYLFTVAGSHDNAAQYLYKVEIPKRDNYFQTETNEALCDRILNATDCNKAINAYDLFSTLPEAEKCLNNMLIKYNEASEADETQVFVSNYSLKAEKSNFYACPDLTYIRNGKEVSVEETKANKKVSVSENLNSSMIEMNALAMLSEFGYTSSPNYLVSPNGEEVQSNIYTKDKLETKYNEVKINPIDLNSQDVLEALKTTLADLDKEFAEEDIIVKLYSKGEKDLLFVETEDEKSLYKLEIPKQTSNNEKESNEEFCYRILKTTNLTKAQNANAMFENMLETKQYLSKLMEANGAQVFVLNNEITSYDKDYMQACPNLIFVKNGEIEERHSNKKVFVEKTENYSDLEMNALALLYEYGYRNSDKYITLNNGTEVKSNVYTEEGAEIKINAIAPEAVDLGSKQVKEGLKTVLKKLDKEFNFSDVNIRLISNVEGKNDVMYIVAGDKDNLVKYLYKLEIPKQADTTKEETNDEFCERMSKAESFSKSINAAYMFEKLPNANIFLDKMLKKYDEVNKSSDSQLFVSDFNLTSDGNNLKAAPKLTFVRDGEMVVVEEKMADRYTLTSADKPFSITEMNALAILSDYGFSGSSQYVTGKTKDTTSNVYTKNGLQTDKTVAKTENIEGGRQL